MPKSSETRRQRLGGESERLAAQFLIAHGYAIEAANVRVPGGELDLVAREGRTLAKVVHDIPASQDEEIARLKLATMGLGIDTLTEEQKRYATDYSAGT